MSGQSLKQGRANALPLGILVAGLVLTLISSLSLRESVQTEARRDFELGAREALRRLDTRVQSYIALLRGGAALLAVDPNSNRAEWSRYVDRLRVEEMYPGVQGIGFTKRFPRSDLELIEQSMRDQGLSDFRVWPDHPREEYHAIVYLEPLDRRNRAALGFDMFTEPVRREAMERAWTNGHAAASGKVELVQEIEGPKQAGFLIYVPVWIGGARPETVAERREKLAGFVYCPFRAGDLIEATFKEELLAVNVSVHDTDKPDKANELYATAGSVSDADEEPLKRSLPIDVSGRTWTLVFTGKKEPGFASTLLFVLPAAGATLSCLLAFLAWREGNSRRRAEAIAAELNEQREALRRAQTELSRHAAELEVKVQERTARLSETIGELEAFSYSISHDLRAPLRAMNAFAKIVVEEAGDKLDAESKGHLERIVAAAARMDQLITDVLAYSRVARTEIRLETIEVLPLLREIVDQYPSLQEPRATVKIHEPIAPVIAEAASLTQCLSNLMTNAAKFVAPGVKPVITVRGERDGECVRIWVEDNGIGIAPEHQQRVFKMFERLNPHGQYDGTGIGLAIVKKAVQRMSGEIGLESRPRGGSSFWIRLPRG